MMVTMTIMMVTMIMMIMMIIIIIMTGRQVAAKLIEEMEMEDETRGRCVLMCKVGFICIKGRHDDKMMTWVVCPHVQGGRVP